MLGSSVTPRKVERTATRVIEGEALIMVIDRRELHRLNEVGTRVFELCDGLTSIEAISAMIVHEFEVSEAIARADVERFVAQLVAAGAITLEAQA